MKVELVKIKFGKEFSYKYKPYKNGRFPVRGGSKPVPRFIARHSPITLKIAYRWFPVPRRCGREVGNSRSSRAEKPPAECKSVRPPQLEHEKTDWGLGGFPWRTPLHTSMSTAAFLYHPTTGMQKSCRIRVGGGYR